MNPDSFVGFRRQKKKKPLKIAEYSTISNMAPKELKKAHPPAFSSDLGRVRATREKMVAHDVR